MQDIPKHIAEGIDQLLGDKRPQMTHDTTKLLKEEVVLNVNHIINFISKETNLDELNKLHAAIVSQQTKLNEKIVDKQAKAQDFLRSLNF
jgi:hypothetical protein